MNVEFKISKDGSSTLFVPALNEHYHSMNGAITEAKHVYVDQGLNFFINSNNTASEINLLEIGFGTGLNALVTALNDDVRTINYDGLELNPLSNEVLSELNFTQQLSSESISVFEMISSCRWNESEPISSRFNLTKLHTSIFDWKPTKVYHVIYFDAFAPEIQPEMWEIPLLQKIANASALGAVLTTYCAKGEVRRRLQSVGFKVFRIPGPPGKREMIRAVKQ